VTVIADIRVRTVAVPLDPQPAFSTRSVAERHYVLVEVEGDDQVVGTGFCYAGHRGGQLVAQAVRDLLAPTARGADIHRVARLWEDLYQEALLHGRTGIVMRALSALDIALWDHNAKAAGLPLHKLLGSAAGEDRVAAYASGGYYVDGKSPRALAAEARSYIERGFSAVKIKVGRHADLGGEEQRLAAVRDEIGSGPLLMLDANNAFADLETARRFMRMAESYDPYWIEEPFSPDDIDNHARLAQLTSVPIATGEIEAGRWRFMELMRRGAATIVQPDVAVCGGVTEFRRIAAMAEGLAISVCPHWFQDVHAHLVASTPMGRFVEVFPGVDVFNFGRLLDRALTVRDGHIELPATPGIGVTYDSDAIEAFALRLS
jgi:L-alanine-DL-glutamate epimerase-like enolase superfamily enzyme